MSSSSTETWAQRLGHPRLSLGGLPGPASTRITQSVPRLSPELYSAAGVAGAARSAIVAGPDGTVEVTVTGPGAEAAATAAGARTVASFGQSVTVSVEAGRLVALAHAAGVSRVASPQRAYPQGSVGQQVVTTDAQTWLKAGLTGAGVKIGIVDVGYGDLAAQVKAGNLPKGLKITGTFCQDARTDANTETERHGTAVAEIVHQMAPSAKLYLYCVDDNVGFAQAEAAIQADGVRIVNSSLGFSADGRGDGTGVSAADFVSTAVTVKKAYDAGILWFESAGNSAQEHWSGSLSDQEADGTVRMLDTSPQPDVDVVALLPDTGALLSLDWDQWPSGSAPVSLQVSEYSSVTLSAASLVGTQTSTTDDNGLGLPVRNVDITNISASVHYYVIRVLWNLASAPAPTSTLRFDLTYLGDASPSVLADPSLFGLSSAYGDPARAAAGSVLEPASSPYVVAVGAQFWNGGLEAYSSRGPTIDGRSKPDILAPDGVSSPIYGSNNGSANDVDGFFGTSAASPAAAGAAALYLSANPTATAATVRAAVLARVDPIVSPPDNASGSGPLKLGAPDAGSLYQPITPTRVVDTRSGRGAPKGALGSGRTLTVSLPTAVPSTATAVVAQVTAAGASGASYLSAYPSNRAATASVNVAAHASATTTVTVGISRHRFVLRNNGKATNVLVDVVGYFGRTGSGFTRIAPVRLLDTRTSVGKHHAKVTGHETISVHPSTGRVPLNATAVVLQVTALGARGSGWFTAYGRTYHATSALSYTTKATTALVVAGTAGGVVHLRNAGAAVDLVVDVVGYFSPSGTGRFHPMTSPARIVSTSTGIGTGKGVLVNRSSRHITNVGADGVPHTATALWLSVTGTGHGTGELRAYPSGPAPAAPAVQLRSGQAESNAAVVGLQSSGFTIAASGTSSDTSADLYGYFTG